MSGELFREVSATVFGGGTLIGDIETTDMSSESITSNQVSYRSSGTSNVTTLAAPPGQASNSAITWPGFQPSGGQVLSAADASGQLTWATALSGSDPLITVAQRVRVKQNPGVGEFLFIAQALASITDASASKPYIVEIGPGVYPEGNLVIPSFVMVKGQGRGAVFVTPVVSSHTFVMQDQSGLADVTVRGPTNTGIAGVVMNTAGECYVDHVCVTQTDIGILTDSSVGTVMMHSSHLYTSQNVNTAILCRNTGAGISRCVVHDLVFNNTLTGTTETILEANGANSTLVVLGLDASLTPGETPYGTAMSSQNGGTLKVVGSRISRFAVGVSMPADAGSPRANITGIDIDEVTQHVNVANTSASGYFFSDIMDLNVFSINAASSFHISNTDNRIVTVATRGGNFTTVKDALAYVTGQVPTITSPWLIRVGPGTFSEDNPLQIPQYVSIEGNGQDSTFVIAINNSVNLFEILSNAVRVDNFATSGPTAAAAFYYGGVPLSPTAGFFVSFYRLGVGNTMIGFDIDSSPGVVITDFLDVSMGGTIGGFDGSIARYGIRFTQGPGSLLSALSIVGFILVIPPGQGATGVPPYTSFTAVDFTGATGAAPGDIGIFTLQLFQRDLVSVSIGIACDNASLDFVNGAIHRFGTGILLKASTLPVTVGVAAFNSIENSGLDFVVQNNNSSGAVHVTHGVLARIDDSAAPNHDISFFTHSTRTEGFTFTGPVNMGTTLTTTTPMLQSFQHSATTPGVLTGGVFSLTGGLGIQVAAGDGYTTSGTEDGDPVYVAWTSALTDTMPADSDRYISVIPPGTIQLTASIPSVFSAMTIARVKSDATSIVFVEVIQQQASHMPTRIDNTLREAFGPIVASGIIGSAGTGAFQISVGSGKYYFSTHEYAPTGGTDITFIPYHHTAGAWVNDTATDQLSAVNARRYDDGTNLVALAGGEWVKHALYILNDGTFEVYLFIYGQTVFASQSAAENGNLPTLPPFVGENVAGVSALVLGDASVDWVTVQDIRPTLQFTAAGVTATTDHGSLTGLLDDDHVQYLLVNGTRAMSGVLNMNANNITNPGTIDGVTITDMSGRLRPGGADEIPTASAITINALTNAVGTSTSLARADHEHAHGVQTDATLHAVATGGANGFMASADKTKLDAATSASTVSTLVERDGSGSIRLDGLVMDGNGNIQFSNSGDTFHVTLQAPAALAADYTLTLPPDDGTPNQVLQTNGNGLTTWVNTGSFTNPMVSSGDMIIRNAGNVDDRLPIGTDTNQVLSVDATGVPSWKSVGVVRDPTVTTNIHLMDDFIMSPTQNWLNNDSSKVLAYDLAEGDALGIAQLDTVSGSNASSYAIMAGSSSLRGGLGSFTIKARVLFQDLSAGGQTSEFQFGVADGVISNAAALLAGNGAVFYLADDADIQIRTAAGATLTSQASSPLQTVVVNSWYTAQIVVTANGAGTWTQIDFIWDGVNIGSITTNLPNAVSQNFRPLVYLRKNVGNNSHACLVDYIYMDYDMVSVR